MHGLVKTLKKCNVRTAFELLPQRIWEFFQTFNLLQVIKLKIFVKLINVQMTPESSYFKETPLTISS